MSQQHTTRDENEGGQILVLAALLMVILIGITGLAIDVSAAYMADRWQRSVADAASLAGGQDLQIPGSRDVPKPPDQQRAREHAMQVLVYELGSTGNATALAATPACLSAAGCPLPDTPYVVSIRTPSPSYVDCVRDVPQGASRCIQVSILQPSFGLTFGRIFGQTSWTVKSTSVAGTAPARQYGLVTLRPPNPRNNGTDAYQDDLFINGGSQVIVQQADVGVNTNLIYSGTNSALVLDSNYNLTYHDTYIGWVGNPTGVSNSSLILDPIYPIPTASCGLACTYDNETQAMDVAGCDAQQALVPATYKELKTNYYVNDPTHVTAKCFKPGIYHFTLTNSTDQVAYLLEPGVFYFDDGLNIGSTVIGGYDPDKAGVALVFLEAHNPTGTPGQMTTSGNTSLVALNFGSAYLTSGLRARAADGPQGPVKTPGTGGVLMSLLVRPDPTCVVVEPAPSACDGSHNNTLKLTGGGNIFLAGIQYAPSDNAEFKGNTGQTAEVGQLITWTLKFASSVFNITGALPETNGVLRLDPACSPTVSTCNP